MAGEFLLFFEEPSKVEIKGEAQAKGFDGWVDVESFNVGFLQTGTWGQGTGGGAGKVEPHDFSFSKRIDKATPQIYAAITTGAHFGRVTFVARKAGGEQEKYFFMMFYGVLISAQNIAGAGDAISEQVTLNYAKALTAYVPQTAKGDPGVEITHHYDFATQDRG